MYNEGRDIGITTSEQILVSYTVYVGVCILCIPIPKDVTFKKDYIYVWLSRDYNYSLRPVCIAAI